MKSITLVSAFILFATSSAFCQAGSAGFQILELGYSARDLSLASSSDAIASEPIAIFTNPAGLVFNESSKGIGLDVMLTHRTYIAGTTVDMFGTRFKAAGMSFGTSLLLSSVPDIQIRTTPGESQGTFSAKDFVFALGAARRFGGLDVGLSAMYLYEKLFVYQSTGLAFNAGVKYSPAENVELGLSAGNIGSSSAMISEKIALPVFVRLGGSYTKPIGEGFALTGFADAVTFKSGGVTPAVGAELSFKDLVNFRAGYASGSEMTGVSFGAGVNYEFLQFDYSYVPLKLDFGNSQTFTLSFLF